MIFSIDQTFDESMKTIRLAVSKVYPMFRPEAFSFEDIVQETVLGLLKCKLPFCDVKVLYTAAYRKALDYLRILSGRPNNKEKERRTKCENGQKKMYSFDREFGDKFSRNKNQYDLTPADDEIERAREANEELDWIESKLHGFELMLVRLRRQGFSFQEIAKQVGTSPSYISILFKQIRLKVQNAKLAEERRPHHRASC